MGMSAFVWDVMRFGGLYSRLPILRNQGVWRVFGTQLPRLRFSGPGVCAPGRIFGSTSTDPIATEEVFWNLRVFASDKGKIL